MVMIASQDWPKAIRLFFWNEGEEEKSEERRKNRPMKKGQAEAALVAAAASSQYIIECIGSLEVSILKKYSL